MMGITSHLNLRMEMTLTMIQKYQDIHEGRDLLQLVRYDRCGSHCLPPVLFFHHRHPGQARSSRSSTDTENPLSAPVRFAKSFISSPISMMSTPSSARNAARSCMTRSIVSLPPLPEKSASSGSYDRSFWREAAALSGPRTAGSPRSPGSASPGSGSNRSPRWNLILFFPRRRAAFFRATASAFADMSVACTSRSARACFTATAMAPDPVPMSTTARVLPRVVDHHVNQELRFRPGDENVPVDGKIERIKLLFAPGYRPPARTGASASQAG